MPENLDNPKDIAPAAMEISPQEGIQRIDGECEWKGDKWRYKIYKLNDVAGTIRIDLRKAI